MKYRLVETAPDFKIIDGWESPSVSVKTPTANQKPEATYEELQEQRDRLAEEIENLKSNLTWNITEQINESEPK